MIREPQPLYRVIAGLMVAIANCEKNGSSDGASLHQDQIKALVDRHMPSGSGFDGGTEFDFDRSTTERLVFHTSFHHMNADGYYDGWTEHTVTVRPSLYFETTLAISGRNRNDIKDLISEEFDYRLSMLIDPWEGKEG